MRVVLWCSFTVGPNFFPIAVLSTITNSDRKLRSHIFSHKHEGEREEVGRLRRLRRREVRGEEAGVLEGNI